MDWPWYAEIRRQGVGIGSAMPGSYWSEEDVICQTGMQAPVDTPRHFGSSAWICSIWLSLGFFGDDVTMLAGVWLHVLGLTRPFLKSGS